MAIARALAEQYAGWFKCLGDATRIQILSVLASSGGAIPVHMLVRALDVGQPTVSHHVKQLADARFVICERRAATTLVRINRRCTERRRGRAIGGPAPTKCSASSGADA
jgi:DNA-binding transcriptional ArsR family regulator